MHELPENIFVSLNGHDLEKACVAGNGELHSTQLTKAIIDKYLDVRLLRYGQQYSELVINNNKNGLRQQYNKLILFNGQ